MYVSHVLIKNFRSISEGEVHFPGHSVLVGDNNIGKSTILEALDLVLGPERMARRPVINEHDFYLGRYLNSDSTISQISINVTLIGLDDEQNRFFRDNLEWWDKKCSRIVNIDAPEETDSGFIETALRVMFVGHYDIEEDDFVGNTYYLSPKQENTEYTIFRTSEKRICGFLFLRTLRTGSRALSLERGSLLDIVLRLKEAKLKMWEDVLSQLRELAVAESEELGISHILKAVQDSVQTFMPSGMANNPHIRVSDLTRENLRRVLTVFFDCGFGTDGQYAVPYFNQGTGTINALVLSLLTIIADEKQNVIFAMEEPEIAIPPYTQKRIVESIRKRSAQAIFTSHSPYVLEEFDPEHIILLNKNNGKMESIPTSLPPGIKKKQYKEELKRKFCESLMARKILLTEGRTEYDAYIACARHLNEIYGEEHKSLELLGISIVNAESETKLPALGEYYTSLGKTVFAVFDKQTDASRAKITANIQYPFESIERGCENLILNQSSISALRRFSLEVVAENNWPEHLSQYIPRKESSDADIRKSLAELFACNKGTGLIGDFLDQCQMDEMPMEIVENLCRIQEIIEGRLTVVTPAELSSPTL